MCAPAENAICYLSFFFFFLFPWPSKKAACVMLMIQVLADGLHWRQSLVLPECYRKTVRVL